MMNKETTASTTQYSSLPEQQQGGDDTPLVNAVPITTTTEQTVDLVAPVDLSGGYLLDIDVNGTPAVVRVPEGGVKQGHHFTGTVLQEATMSNGGTEAHRIPMNQWRDGICNFTANGCCHPMCCLACWCTPLALGQVMTRMRLSHSGKTDLREARPYWSAFKVIALVFVIYLAIDQTITILINPYAEAQFDPNTGAYVPRDTFPAWVLVLVGIRTFVKFVFFAYMLLLTIRTRSFIRNRYGIQENCCRGCEDCCCAFWLPCCTITQMARHTADYETYNAACCTETGLAYHAPEVV